MRTEHHHQRDTFSGDMPMHANVSAEDLEWLVAQRSANQDACLKLYKVIQEHRSKINNDQALRISSGMLVAILFSLWRAVFLADFKEFENYSTDYEAFLEKLIQHNSVSYVSDREAKHWSFVYYTENARFRLKFIAEKGRLLPKELDISIADVAPQAVWLQAQKTVETAISNFELILRGHTQS